MHLPWYDRRSGTRRYRVLEDDREHRGPIDRRSLISTPVVQHDARNDGRLHRLLRNWIGKYHLDHLGALPAGNARFKCCNFSRRCLGRQHCYLRYFLDPHERHWSHRDVRPVCRDLLGKSHLYLLHDIADVKAGLIFIFYCYPEPSGLSLEEISVVYQYGFGVAKSREIRAAHKAAVASQRDIV